MSRRSTPHPADESRHTTAARTEQTGRNEGILNGEGMGAGSGQTEPLPENVPKRGGALTAPLSSSTRAHRRRPAWPVVCRCRKWFRRFPGWCKVPPPQKSATHITFFAFGKNAPSITKGGTSRSTMPRQTALTHESEWPKLQA